jgi:Spy/CpxP family protein refolding chaperone
MGLMAAGLSIAANKGEHGGWGHTGGQSCHHGAGHETEDYWGGKKSDMRVDHLAKVLDLTDAQKNAIQAIMKSQHQARSVSHQAVGKHLAELAQLASGSDAFSVKAKEIGALHGEATSQGLIEHAHAELQVLALLTLEQVEQYKQMHAEMAEKRAQHMQNHNKKANHST